MNAASPVYEKGQPVAIGHVVFFTPDLATTENFYIEKVGFHLSDAYKIAVHSYVAAVKVITTIYSYLAFQINLRA